MKIYRVQELPNGANLKTIGVHSSEGVIYIKKGLPLSIEIVVLLHEVGHHIDHKIGVFLSRLGASWPKDNALYKIRRCCSKILNPFFAITTLICRKWLPTGVY